MKDLNTFGFSTITLLGSIMTVGFFIVFFILLVKKRIMIESKTPTLVIFDVYGTRAQLNGIRTNFKNHDVALSFSKFYKKEFPLYTFDVMSTNYAQKQIILKYFNTGYP
jgi:hypothetical protein